MNIEAVDNFFRYARERYKIRLDKDAGWPRPWTKDHVLQSYRFCNIFREDDRTTAWFRDNIRERLRDGPSVLLATVIFRWFNKIETGQVLLDDGLFDPGNWGTERARELLRDQRPITNGAYIIKTPNGMNKLDGILWCIDQVEPEAGTLARNFSSAGYSLEVATKTLAQFPYLGPFMAYEVVTDLRHTALLEHASDILSWANPGPGAARGASRIIGREPTHYNRSSPIDRKGIMHIMRGLQGYSQIAHHWPSAWPRWEMREVEHTLCEFDKYERARLGQGRPKQRYNGKGDQS